MASINIKEIRVLFINLKMDAKLSFQSMFGNVTKQLNKFGLTCFIY